MLSMLIGGTLQGEKAIHVGAEFQKVARELMILLGQPNFSDYFPVLGRFDLQGIERRVKKVVRCCEEIIDSAIEQRKVAAGEDMDGKNELRKDFLQVLLELQMQEDEETKLSSTELKALLMDILVGGTDTAATTVEWVMVKLIQHPEVMEKVNKELIRVIGLNNIVEDHHLPKLKYLSAVLKEALRLHPPLPLLVPHCSSQSCVIGGFTIPKGTLLFINIWAIQRDPLLWENPLEFQPDRFLKDPNRYDFSGQSLEFLPFGSGRRICAGLQLADRMLMYMLASFLHTFDWELPHGEELEDSEKFGIVVKKMKPLVLIPKQKPKQKTSL